MRRSTTGRNTNITMPKWWRHVVVCSRLEPERVKNSWMAALKSNVRHISYGQNMSFCTYEKLYTQLGHTINALVVQYDGDMACTDPSQYSENPATSYWAKEKISQSKIIVLRSKYVLSKSFSPIWMRMAAGCSWRV